MIFVFSNWEEFCDRLLKLGINSIPASEVMAGKKYLVLKHDVETDLPKAFEMAKIENKYGQRGSYYIQAYLLNEQKNIDLLKKMQKMGHEISYHHDVMDSNNGNIDNAIVEFENNRKKFENNGFSIKTVCQHGNPIVNRVGYTSNRDFFRSKIVQELYPSIADIMVNFKEKYNTDYIYYSDAGRHFCYIFDPLNNDIVNSDNKNIKYENLNEVINSFTRIDNIIISTHPHRWAKSKYEYIIKNCIFKTVRSVAKLLVNIPGMKRLMSRYYYLAKKM